MNLLINVYSILLLLLAGSSDSHILCISNIYLFAWFSSEATAGKYHTDTHLNSFSDFPRRSLTSHWLVKASWGGIP